MQIIVKTSHICCYYDDAKWTYPRVTAAELLHVCLPYLLRFEPPVSLPIPQRFVRRDHMMGDMIQVGTPPSNLGKLNSSSSTRGGKKIQCRRPTPPTSLTGRNLVNTSCRCSGRGSRPPKCPMDGSGHIQR
jgi:hypothetical protein